MTKLGELVKTLRKEKKWTQRELSEKTGLSPSTISYIEQGKTAQPDMTTLENLARALNYPFASLFSRSKSLKQVIVERIEGILADLSPDDQEDVFDYAERLKERRARKR